MALRAIRGRAQDLATIIGNAHLPAVLRGFAAGKEAARLCFAGHRKAAAERG